MLVKNSWITMRVDRKKKQMEQYTVKDAIYIEGKTQWQSIGNVWDITFIIRALVRVVRIGHLLNMATNKLPRTMKATPQAQYTNVSHKYAIT